MENAFSAKPVVYDFFCKRVTFVPVIRDITIREHYGIRLKASRGYCVVPRTEAVSRGTAVFEFSF